MLRDLNYRVADLTVHPKNIRDTHGRGETKWHQQRYGERERGVLARHVDPSSRQALQVRPSAAQRADPGTADRKAVRTRVPRPRFVAQRRNFRGYIRARGLDDKADEAICPSWRATVFGPAGHEGGRGISR